MGSIFDHISGRQVLLTGHTGFKGAWLCAALHRLGAKVCGVSLTEPVSSPSLFDLACLSSVVEDRRFDIADTDMLRRTLSEFKPDIIIHMAAQPLVRYSYDAPAQTFLTNTVGTLNVLESLRSVGWAGVVLCITTDKVYRQMDSEAASGALFFQETSPLGGRDPYSASKAAAEMVFHSYWQSFFKPAGIGAASVRAGNVIGGGDWALDRVIPDLVRAACDGKRGVIRNPSSVRPWQHVLDALGGYLTLVCRLLTDPQEFSGSWNFGPVEADHRPVCDVADTFYDAWGSGGWDTVNLARAPHEESVLMLDCGKAREQLGWRPKWEFDEAVRRTARWYAGWNEGTPVQDLIAADLDVFFDGKEMDS